MFFDEFFDLAGTIAKCPVAEANDWKKWGFTGGMIPNPVFSHIQTGGNVFRAAGPPA